MIGVYVQNGHVDEAMQLFREMKLACIKPDSVSISCLLPACGLLADLQLGQEIHGYNIKSGLDKNVVVGNALIHMYAKCANPEFARQVFDNMPHRDVVSWNAIISGLAQYGQYDESLQLFSGMNLLGMKPNSITLASVLPACACLGSLKQGKAIHNYLLRSEHGFEIFVTNALIDMYVKCGSIEDACQLFGNMPQRDVVSWNVIIGSTLTRRNCRKSWNFCQMRLDGVKPDSVTIANVLSGCARTGALKQGKEVHCYLITNGFELHVSVGNALIDMYAKCGNVEDAHHVFNRMSEKTVISWNTMIGGYGMHGLGEAALKLFHEMQHNNVKSDYITFIAVLSACSHAGLTKQGLEIFYCMIQQYCITPTVEHYACIVDLLGRAGQLDDALHIIDKMPVEPDASV
jgi:pentatricopeptide repeat protein